MDQKQEYQKLLQDTINFLKNEKSNFCYGSKEEIKRLYSTAILAKPFLEKTFPQKSEKKNIYTIQGKLKPENKSKTIKTAEKEKIIEKKFFIKEEKPKKVL